jgi:Phosphate-induced protein 1 conserved region
MCYFRSPLFVPLCLIILSLGARFSYGDLAEEPPMNFMYHDGMLITGTISVNFIWYGKFTASQKSVLTDFVVSLTDGSVKKEPSVATWWKGLTKYYDKTKISFPTLTLGKQISDTSYSRGDVLNVSDILPIASQGPQQNAINVVVTSVDVGMEGFCISRCGLHGSAPGSSTNRFTFIWLGNSSTQCPGQCAWPFSQYEDGPSTAPLVPPNGEAGTDGMVVNLASLLAGTCTNAFGDGYFQGEPETPLEAATACPGIYGKRAFPGYAGDLLIDPASNASYNAYGVNERRFLVPALFDLTKFNCATTV